MARLLVRDGLAEHLGSYLRSAKRQGIGRRLMAIMAEILASRGLRGGSLWVLRSNVSARRFYEALGGRIIGEREQKRGEHILDEVAYGWEDLRAIAPLNQ